RQAHDEDGDEEGVFAADDVADAAKHDGAEGADQEAGGEGEQREDVAGGRWIIREELRADDAGKRSVEIEVIPFENGTERGSEDDEALLLSHSGRLGRSRSHSGHSIAPQKSLLPSSPLCRTWPD